MRVVLGYAPCTEFADPERVWIADSVESARSALREAQAALEDGYHLAGALSYELGAAMQRVPVHPLLPLLILGAFREPVRRFEPAERGFAIAPPLCRVARDAYAESIRCLLARIRDGAVYQVNYTVPFDAAFAGDPFGLYLALAESSKAPYCGYLEHDALSLVSISPELFLQFDGTRVTTKPMKGTAALGDVSALASEKNRAEHVMIVDLLRNDLHRLCENVGVPVLFETERYPTFATMTSTITGALREGVTLLDVVAATFPCGSVTGAPKRAAIEHIASVEREPRGFYTGSLGYLTPQRRGWWNVAIRTLQIDLGTGTARFDAGGGIVSDSNATDEWEEIGVKSRFLMEACDVALLETMRSDADAEVVASHLDRLGRSAEAFGWRIDRGEIEARIGAFDDGVAPRLLRVRVYRERIEVTAELLESPIEPVRIRVSSLRVRSSDPMLRHKTSWRPVHDAAAQEAAAAGCFDVLLTNERGELTEGARTNLFLEMHGRLRTPSLDAGVLPGVLRSRLFAEGRAIEAVLHREDLDRADAIYVGNSARGLLLAQIAALT